MRQKWIKVLMFLVMLAGMVIFIWPDLGTLENNIINRKVKLEFQKKVREVKVSEESLDEEGVDEEEHADLRNAFIKYNQNLFENHQEDLKDPWSYEKSSFELLDYGLADDVVGIINIPRMNVEMPIYLGATQENMRRGATHLSETSLPIGGNNSNCVIAAHRGTTKGVMFRDIEDLQLGDLVTIQNLWETLTYQVVECKVIFPTDIDEILIRPGEDMVTLLTCHPYTQNYRRYIVYCKRVTSDESGTSNPEVKITKEEKTRYEQVREEALEEDVEIIHREKITRKIGYVIMVVVLLLLLLKLRRKKTPK